MNLKQPYHTFFVILFSDAASRCHVSVHGAPRQGYGGVDRPGGRHC